VSNDAAALIEPLSVGIWANRRAATTLGSRVLITGAGPIGVLAAMAARAAGAGWIGLVDVNPARLETAARFDIDDVIDGRQGIRYASFRPDVLLECTGVPDVVNAALIALQPMGRAVLVGMGESASMTLSHFHRDGAGHGQCERPVST
jgi:L-iditol 2-dehydrogenase